MESLQNADKLKIEWTHIGDGVDFKEIKVKAETNQCKHLTINLLGRLKHDDVIRYYQSHSVDAFINLSTNEGVPVAIMEAISFNIPVIATNVGSTSEIVTDETGMLVSPNPSPTEVAEALYGLLNSTLNPRAFWESHYNAEKNYSAFANKLLMINQIKK
jgi:glycosyltransferase involved in cell wall biosynthesis